MRKLFPVLDKLHNAPQIRQVVLSGSGISGIRFKWNKANRNSQLFDNNSDFDVALLSLKFKKAVAAIWRGNPKRVVVKQTRKHQKMLKQARRPIDRTKLSESQQRSALRKHFPHVLPPALGGHHFEYKYHDWDLAVARHRGPCLCITMDCEASKKMYGTLHGDIAFPTRIRRIVYEILHKIRDDEQPQSDKRQWLTHYFNQFNAAVGGPKALRTSGSRSRINKC